jgi:hypothetical protein
MNKFGLIPGNGNFDLGAIGNLVLLKVPLELIKDIINDSRTKRVQIYFDDEDNNEVVIVINKQNDGTYSFGFGEATEGSMIVVNEDIIDEGLNPQEIMDEVNDQLLGDSNVITSVIAFDNDGHVIYNHPFENNVNDFGKKRCKNIFAEELKYLKRLK